MEKNIVFQVERPLAFSRKCENYVTLNGTLQFLANPSLHECSLAFTHNWPIAFNSILVLKYMTEKSIIGKDAAKMDMLMLAIPEKEFQSLEIPKMEFCTKWR